MTSPRRSSNPARPGRTGYSESFNGRFRDEFLATEQFDTLLEAQVLAEDWGIQYNTIRPHGSLGGLTPTQFHLQWINQPADTTAVQIVYGSRCGARDIEHADGYLLTAEDPLPADLYEALALINKP